MALKIEKAQRKQRKAKICLEGPSGSGKTYTALSLAVGLAGREGPLDEEPKILLIDTENRSAALYADEFSFDILHLEDFAVRSYLDAIRMGVDAHYEVVIVDSLSHAWQHLLEEHENLQKRDRSVNSFTAWAKITPIFNQLIAGIVQCPVHTICTLRSKTEYVLEETERNGRKSTTPRKVGMAAQFRAGSEYEFDVVGPIDLEHNLIIQKTRLRWLDERVINKPGSRLGAEIREWLGSGAPIAQPVAPTTLSAGPRAGTLIQELKGRDLSHYLQIHGSDIPPEEVVAVQARYDELRRLHEESLRKKPAEPYANGNDTGGTRPAITEAQIERIHAEAAEAAEGAE